MTRTIFQGSLLAVTTLAVLMACGKKDDTEEGISSMTDDVSSPFAMVAGDAPTVEKRPVEIESWTR